MKKIWIVFALLLFGTVTTIAVAGSGRESTMLPPQEVQIMYSSEDHGYQQKDINGVIRWKTFVDGSFATYNSSGNTIFSTFPDGSFAILDSSGNTRFKVLPDGSLSMRDSSGTTDFYVPSDRVVYITSYTQLSTWSGQASTAGQSYFQCQPGKSYYVDPVAINASIVAKVGAGNSTFAGVTAVLPDASSYSGPAYNTTVGILQTGTTGYATMFAGATPVYVWPYPGSGTTWYGGQAKTVPQTLFTEYTSSGTTNGTVTNTNYLTSGASYWEIDKLREWTTFGLYNGQVSAFVVDKKIYN